MPFEWRELLASRNDTTVVTDPRRRMNIVFFAFLLLAGIVFCRVVQLEISQGAQFREEALRPIEKRRLLPASRGQISSSNGTLLAYDKPCKALAMHYRWLQNPPEERWLLDQARSRLPKNERKNAQKIAAAKDAIRAEHLELHKKLAKLCGLSLQQWQTRTKKIQDRVEQIAAKVNKSGQTASIRSENNELPWWKKIQRLLFESPPTPEIVVAEQLSYHIVVEDIAPAVVEEIESAPASYPGVKIVETLRRIYPQGTMAAHILGYPGAVDKEDLKQQPQGMDAYLPDDRIGRTGVEQRYESFLRGQRGEMVDRIDRAGRIISSYETKPAIAGKDVVLTIETTLQQTAEELLQSAVQRRTIVTGASEPAGGAIVVMDCNTGAIRAAASFPTFNPNIFAQENSQKIVDILNDKSKPLFNRVVQMAIPPGSTFKILSAIALLESGTVGPQEKFHCQGYLHDPDHQRCEIFVRQGVGHGEVTLSDALCVSCNVYFFHYCGIMGYRPLADWAERFGFGRPTDVDLPGEVVGTMPLPENTSETQAMSIGQGGLTVTPLQMVRLVAAVANGGRLVTPYVVERIGDERLNHGLFSQKRIAGLHRETLNEIRAGLVRVVADRQGTAYGTVYTGTTSIAGKTGTAETSDSRSPHAWFAGYAPAERPKVAFVVVIEHAGSGAIVAGPIVKRLVLRMEQSGLL